MSGPVAALAAAVLCLGAAAGCSAEAGASQSAPSHAASTKATPKPEPSPSGAAPGSPKAKPSKKPVEHAKPAPKALMAQGSQGRQVRELQARLRAIGHFQRPPTGYYGSVTAAAVRSFQAKRGLPGTGRTDRATWDRLVAMTKPPARDQLYPPTANALDKPDPRCMTGRVLCVSKRSNTLRWMNDGHVVSAMDVRFGSQFTPTREGTFRIFQKSRDWVSTIFHTPMPYAMFFSGGQAVHYSADFAARGYAGASHGCVNVRDRAKISALFAQVRIGDEVVVYR
jgi:Putative peptidoglycan binding domain/L,D-transpeptidase catalytic domain